MEMPNDNSVAAHDAHLSFYVFIIINESMTRESPEIYLWIHFTFGFFFLFIFNYPYERGRNGRISRLSRPSNRCGRFGFHVMIIN